MVATHVLFCPCVPQNVEEVSGFGVYVGTLQEEYSAEKQRFYNCRGTVFIKDLHTIVVNQFTFQPSFSFSENVTFWAGPADPDLNSASDDHFSNIFPSENGFYLKPKKIESGRNSPPDGIWPYIVAKIPTRSQIASISTGEKVDKDVTGDESTIVKPSAEPEPEPDSKPLRNPEPSAEPSPESEPVSNRFKRQLSGTARYALGAPPPAFAPAAGAAPEIFYRGSWDTSPFLSSVSQSTGQGYGIPLSRAPAQSSNILQSILGGFNSAEPSPSFDPRPQDINPLGTAQNLLKNLFGAAGSLNSFEPPPSHRQQLQLPNYQFYRPPSPPINQVVDVNPFGNLVGQLFGGQGQGSVLPPQDTLLQKLLNLIPQASTAAEQEPKADAPPVGEPSPPEEQTASTATTSTTLHETSPLSTTPQTHTSPLASSTTSKPLIIPDASIAFKEDRCKFGRAIEHGRVRLIVDGGVVEVPASNLVKSLRPNAITLSNAPPPVALNSSLDAFTPDQLNAVSFTKDLNASNHQLSQPTTLISTTSTLVPTTSQQIKDEKTGIEALGWHAGFHPLQLTLPLGRTTRDLNWISVWDHDHKEAVASVLIPQGPGLRIPDSVTFRGLKAALPFKEVHSGAVQVIDAKTIRIHDFFFEGDAPGAWFMVGKDLLPHPGGDIVPIYHEHNDTYDCDFLGAYAHATVTLKLPADVQVRDVFWLSVFCVPYAISFAHIYLPFADIVVPPTPHHPIVPRCLLEQPNG